MSFVLIKVVNPQLTLCVVSTNFQRADRELWKVTLDTAYWRSYIQREQQANGTTKLRERFLKLVLLHPSRSVKSLFYYFPDAASLLTWEDVARFVFADIFEA